MREGQSMWVKVRRIGDGTAGRRSWRLWLWLLGLALAVLFLISLVFSLALLLLLPYFLLAAVFLLAVRLLLGRGGVGPKGPAS